MKSDSPVISWCEISSHSDMEASYKHLGSYIQKNEACQRVICLSYGQREQPFVDFREICITETAPVFSVYHMGINILSSPDGSFKRITHCI